MDEGFWYDVVRDDFEPSIREADTVAEAFAAAATLWPDDPFATDATTGETMTFGGLATRAEALAGALDSVGVTAGDRVGLYLHNSIEYVVAIAACAGLGAVQTPIDWHYKPREAAHAFDTADVSTVIVERDAGFFDVLDETLAESPVTDVVVLDETAADETEPDTEAHGDGEDGATAPAVRDFDGADTHRRSALSGDAPTVGRDADDPVAILYTSGTTGLPKPAVLSNESFLLAAASIRAAPFPDGDVNYNPFPLFHANAQCYSLLGSVLSGTEYVLANRFSASSFFDHVQRHGVTSFNILGGVPKMLLAAHEDEPVPDTELDLAVGPISTEAWEPFADRLDIDVVQAYSQTEHPVVVLNHPDREQIRHGAIGKPVFPDLGHEARVLDDDGEPVGVDEPGELARSAVGAMDGYRELPEKTAETLRDGWLYSGDIVRRDEDGYLYYVDRKKFMIRRSGQNISAREVEDVIDELPGVAASAAIPVPDDVRGEAVKVLVKRADGAEGAAVTERDVVAHVASTLAAYKVPRYVAFVDSFPRTPSERIQRVDLANDHEDREHAWDREQVYPNWRDDAS